MYLGIDSSKNLQYTFMVTGKFRNMIDFYDEMEKIFRKQNINPPFHWSKINKKIKESSSKKIERNIQESNLNFTVIEHKRSKGENKRNYYHNLVPGEISQILGTWLKAKNGEVVIEVDDDYNLSRYNTTKVFLRNLMKKTCYRIIGKHVKLRSNKKIRTTIKQKNGLLEICGYVSNIRESKGIQIIDIVGGYLTNKKIKYDGKRLFFRKI